MEEPTELLQASRLQDSSSQQQTVTAHAAQNIEQQMYSLTDGGDKATDEELPSFAQAGDTDPGQSHNDAVLV